MYPYAMLVGTHGRSRLYSNLLSTFDYSVDVLLIITKKFIIMLHPIPDNIIKLNVFFQNLTTKNASKILPLYS